MMKIQSLDLHITDRCNLKCPYCYLHQPTYRRRPDIDEETIKILPEVVQRLGVRRVNFFGGEPLLAFDKIRRIVETLKGCKVTFSISTNGTICDEEIAQFLKHNRISVQRSIDGCPEVCELNRPGSVQRYIELTRLFEDYGRPRRSTITESSVRYTYRSWLWLKEVGFDQGWTPIPDNYAEWSDEAVGVFVEHHKLIARDLVERVRRGQRPFYNYWFNRVVPCVLNPGRMTPKGCGAGVGLLALRQDGCFFACHRFISDDSLSDWCFGHIDDVLSGRGLAPGPDAERVINICKKQYATAPVFEQCRQCPVNTGCPGGCYHTNRAINNDAAKPTTTFCRIRQGMLPIVRWIHEQLKDINPRWYQPSQASPSSSSSKSPPRPTPVDRRTPVTKSPEPQLVKSNNCGC